MNIHYSVGLQRIPTPRGHKPNNTAKPPRTREGTDTKRAHNAYPGGKHYRKAMTRLAARINGKQQGKRPDRINAKDETTPWGSYGFVKPGSMRK